MDDIVAQCLGVLAIHDDMFIYGKDDKDHDANIINLFNVAQKKGLIFNSARSAIKQDSVTFFGGRSRSRKNPRHLRDDTPSDETSTTVISRSSQLSSDFCSPSQSPYLTTKSPPEK